jgi:hypothetical protein
MAGCRRPQNVGDSPFLIRAIRSRAPWLASAGFALFGRLRTSVASGPPDSDSTRAMEPVRPAFRPAPAAGPSGEQQVQGWSRKMGRGHGSSSDTLLCFWRRRRRWSCACRLDYFLGFTDHAYLAVSIFFQFCLLLFFFFLNTRGPKKKKCNSFGVQSHRSSRNVLSSFIFTCHQLI